MSGPTHETKSKELGKNVRECTLMLEKARRLGDKLPDKIVGVVSVPNQCADESKHDRLSLGP